MASQVAHIILAALRFCLFSPLSTAGRALTASSLPLIEKLGIVQLKLILTFDRIARR